MPHRNGVGKSPRNPTPAKRLPRPRNTHHESIRRTTSSRSPPRKSSGSSPSSGKDMILPQIKPNGHIETKRSNSRGRSPNGSPMGVTSSVFSPSSSSSSNNNSMSGAVGIGGDDSFSSINNRCSQNAQMEGVFRIVRMCAAQNSCRRLISLIERETAGLIRADRVRLFTVHRDTLRHSNRNYPVTGLTGWALEQRKPVALHENLQRDQRYSANIDDCGRPASAACFIPMEADSNPNCTGLMDVVAVIQCFRLKFPSEPFTQDDVAVLRRLCSFVGNQLRHSRNVDRALSQFSSSLNSHKRSAALLDVAKALASETKLDNIVSIIVSQVPELLDSDRCTLFFVDNETEELIVTKGASKGRQKSFVSWIFGQSNAPELPFEEGSNEIRFSMRKGVAGHVAVTGSVVNIVDAHKDKRFNPAIDRATGYRTRSILCLPLKDAQGHILGVVQAINKNPLHPEGFNNEDETLLRTFSAQAALAVKNSRLLQQTKSALRQSDALLEVTQALSQELKIDQLIGKICFHVQELLNAERCTVFIVDKEKKELYTSGNMTHGMGPALPVETQKTTMVRFPMGRGIAGTVGTEGHVVNIPDAYNDSRFNKAFDQKTGFRTRAILCMPIVNHSEETVGVLQCMNKIPTRRSTRSFFDDNDEKLLKAFCSPAAVAIENNLLFQQTEKALNHALADQRNLKFMLSVTKNLFSDMHLTSMIDQMTLQVHHLLKADDCALYLVDNKTKEFYLAKDEADPKTRRYPFTTGIVGVVAKTGKTVRISTEAHLNPKFHPDVDQRKGKTTHSILCCPIKSETPDSTSIIGVISVRDEKDRGGFEAEEEKLLKVFCAQAAVAIMNSRRFSSIMENSEAKTRDHSAADYLKVSRGMKLASDDIDSFNFKMSDINLKGAIGTGSYGEVYRAVVRGKIVAVKKLHVRNLKAEQVDAFCKEASLMCQLEHENVVGFIGAVTEPSNLCIITDYCARGSLADLLLDEMVPMTYERKLKFAIDAAAGMLYLHNSNPVILHRDLKSDNLLVSKDWTIKVADFGLTRFLSEKKAMTQVGTPMWMAPEIILGRKYTEKADVYAYGIILWEILTRLEPYEDKEPMQIVVEVVNDNLRPTIPEEHKENLLVPLLQDCWHKDPGERPTFRVILERLSVIWETTTGSALDASVMAGTEHNR